MTDTDTIQHTEHSIDEARLEARYEAQMRLLLAIHAEIQPQQAARNELFAN